MKISVIIPVYNGEKYVAQCLDNVMCQTYKNLEIIVVNDGSTDDSGKIAEKFPVKVINQENLGQPVARNVGIDNATGDYIHFMDVDDLINLEFYENMLTTAIDTDADMVCCEVIHERVPRLSIRYDNRLVVSYIEDKLTLTKVRLQGYSVRYLYRTSFLKSNGLKFDKEFCNIEDLFFSFKAVYYANKIATVPKSVYYYKHRTNSLITSREKQHRIKKRFFEKQANLLCDNFAKEHGLTVVYPPPQKKEYKLFGIPLCKKLTLCNGKERWYLFGIYVFQRK